MKKSYKIIFLDFNGTIINDVDLCYRLLNQLLTEQNTPTVSFETYKEIFGFPVIEYYKRAGFDFTKCNFSDLAEEFVREYQPASLHCDLYPGIFDFIKDSKEKGLKVVVLSASEISRLKEQLTHFGLVPYLDDILGIQDIHAAGKVDLAKEYITSNHIDPKDCVFIGDTDHDYLVAQTLAMDCILTSYGHQSKRRLLELTDSVVDTVDEFKKYIR